MAVQMALKMKFFSNENKNQEEYKSSNSKQHFSSLQQLPTIDPRITLFWCFSLILVISLTSFSPLLKWLILSLIISANFRVGKFSLRTITRRFLLLLPLLIFLSLSIFFFGSRSSSPFPQKHALEILIRSLLVWGSLISCFGLLRFEGTLQALDRLRCPRSLTMMVGLTFRFLPLIRENLEHQHHALQSRLFGRLSWPRKLHLAKSIISHNFFQVFEKAQKIHWCLISRNFSGKWTSSPQHHLTWWEWGLIGLISLFNGVFLWWS